MISLGVAISKRLISENNMDPSPLCCTHETVVAELPRRNVAVHRSEARSFHSISMESTYSAVNASPPRLHLLRPPQQASAKSLELGA